MSYNIKASEEAVREYDALMTKLGYDEYCVGETTFDEIADGDIDASWLANELEDKLRIIDDLYIQWDWTDDPAGKRKAQKERANNRRAVKIFKSKHVKED